MPKLKIRSTAHVLTLPAPAEGRLTYFDATRGAPAGFCVRVSATARAYYQTFRLRSRFVWFKIGAPPLGITKARQKAHDVLAQLQLAKTGLGPDPLAEREQKRRDEQKTVPTFAVLCSAFVDDRERTIAPRTSAEYRRMIAAYVGKHRIGRMRAVDVTALDLKVVLTEMAATAPVGANRLHGFLSVVCRWAAKLGAIPVNPMAVVDRPSKEATRERVLSDAEIAYVWKATEDERPAVRAAVRLLLLLGQRASETLLGLRWDGLDLDAAIPTWTIPGSFRKGGALHVVPLPKAAVQMIEALRPVTGASASGRVLDGVSALNYEVTWWGRVRDRALDLAREDGVDVARFTRHDLRRTTVTGMTTLGVAPHVADLVVGHVVGSKVSRTYNRSQYLAERASALSAWCAHVEKVASGEKKRADVLPMARA